VVIRRGITTGLRRLTIVPTDIFPDLLLCIRYDTPTRASVVYTPCTDTSPPATTLHRHASPTRRFLIVARAAQRAECRPTTEYRLPTLRFFRPLGTHVSHSPFYSTARPARVQPLVPTRPTRPLICYFRHCFVFIDDRPLLLNISSFDAHAPIYNLFVVIFLFTCSDLLQPCPSSILLADGVRRYLCKCSAAPN